VEPHNEKKGKGGDVRKGTGLKELEKSMLRTFFPGEGFKHSATCKVKQHKV